MPKGLKYIIVSVLIIFVIVEFAKAQEKRPDIDSTKLYRDIEDYSKRSKFNKLVYELIFKKTAVKLKKKEIKKKKRKKVLQHPYNEFEGKIIRHINITTLDPFGYSISDTNVTSETFLNTIGNALHVKSQNITIRNFLLIKRNQIFDSLLVKESERLVRSRGFVRDVSFYVKLTSKKSDSVDVFIRELDNWSLVPIVIITSSHFNLRLTDKNFVGFGHEFQNSVNWHFTTGKYAYSTNYFIPNINNSYVSTTLHYGYDEDKNYVKSIAVDRPFFSPFTRWAAGVSFSQQFRYDSIREPDSLFSATRLKYNTQDHWIGHAIRIFKGNTEYNRTTNFITALRYIRVRYLENPSVIFDTLGMYANENFYLAGIGVSARRYVQDKFIYKYGITEDVPVGKVFGLTYGYQVKPDSKRVYVGARFSIGSYYRSGYLSINFEYGTFIRASHSEQGVFLCNVMFFTELLEIGKWKFRQFVKPQLVIGINRFSYDSLSLNDGPGLDGFNSSLITGTSRLLLTLQTQAYSPWNFIGFRFGPYFVISVGKLGKATGGFIDSKIYSQIGLGVLIKNENLIISTFQISFSFYPIIPGKGQNIFKVNSFKSSDFGFRDFEFGKPGIVLYH